MINEKYRVILSSWEKRNIAEKWKQATGLTLDQSCGNCWKSAIEKLAKTNIEEEAQKPILVKDKMIVHDEPLTMEHVGAGWYQFSDGHRVRGKNNAEAYLKKKK